MHKMPFYTQVSLAAPSRLESVWEKTKLVSSAKKSREIKINKFHEILFWPNSIFCNFKNVQKSNFELGKSLKLPKMQFHEKKIWFIWFHEFFCLDFFKFSETLCILILVPQETFQKTASI